MPISLFVHGHFVRGEHVLVRVCLRADHSVASSSILESSGDQRFDELALEWARRVRLREATGARPVASCGPVRVELHDTSSPEFGPASERLSFRRSPSPPSA
jgi:TonB family protein